MDVLLGKTKRRSNSRKLRSESENETSDESLVKIIKKSTYKPKSKRTRNEDDSIDENQEKKKPKKGDLKLDAVMVIYDIDDSMPDLQVAYNGKSGTLLLSDLLDLNPKIKRSDVSNSISY